MDPKVFLNFEGRWHSKKFGNPDVVLADTLDDLDSDSAGKNTFLDVTRRQEGIMNTDTYFCYDES